MPEGEDVLEGQGTEPCQQSFVKRRGTPWKSWSRWCGGSTFKWWSLVLKKLVADNGTDIDIAIVLVPGLAEHQK